MKVYLLRKRHRTSRGRSTLLALEWFFLLFGLVALDLYIWVNTSAALYQAYEDRVFDQSLQVSGVQPLGATPSARNALARSGIVGRLEIPNLHLTAMVREGMDRATLRRAVGHIPGTALPGAMGNVGLAGHRDTFFRALRNIRSNDAIELQTENGTFTYAVESTRIVGPRDVRVLAPSGAPSLTLVTCYPFYYVGSAPKRFIVQATLVSAVLNHPSAAGL
jgi:sortase A